MATRWLQGCWSALRTLQERCRAGAPLRGANRRWRRVAARDYSPAAPTAPDVPNEGIRLLGLSKRDVTRRPRL